MRQLYVALGREQAWTRPLRARGSGAVRRRETPRAPDDVRGPRACRARRRSVADLLGGVSSRLGGGLGRLPRTGGRRLGAALRRLRTTARGRRRRLGRALRSALG